MRKLHTSLCPHCGRSFETRRNKYCSSECRKSAFSSNSELRRKISIGRKRFLSENPDKHPWKQHTKFQSVPCEKLKDYMDYKGIKYVSEFTPLTYKNYSIDIAFPDIKVGIEINGNQHYESDRITLLPYYQDRHDAIVAAGWNIIELHYLACYKIEVLDELFANFKQNIFHTSYVPDFKQKARTVHCALPRGHKVKNANAAKYEPLKEVILSAEIDFSKFGWVRKVAEILDLPSQKVSCWMKKYLPDFYEAQCFKRKTK